MKNRKRILILILGVAVVVLLGYQLRHNKEWQSFSWAAVWEATRRARGWFIIGSVALIYASYLIRAVRWQVLMTPTGQFWPVLKGTVIGFTGTAVLGRAGELVRPYYIAKKHDGELSPQLAVWLLERVFDMAGVVLLVGLALGLDPELKTLTRDSGYQAAFHRAGILLSLGVVVLIGLLYLFHLRARRVVAKLQRQEGLHPNPVRRRIDNFIAMLAQGMEGLRRVSTLLAAMGLTALLWIDISASIWLVVRAYPTMLPGFGFGEGLLLMALTAIGSVAQLPGVGGGFQVLTIFGLTKIFGAPAAAATSAALIVWLVCFYAIAPFGAALATHEGVSWRGMEAEAEKSNK